MQRTKGVNVRVSRETLSTPHLAARDPHRSREPHLCGRQCRPDWSRLPHLQSERRLPIKLRTECATATVPGCRILRREGARRVSRETSTHALDRKPDGLPRRFDGAMTQASVLPQQMVAVCPRPPHFSTRDSSGRAAPVCDPQSVSRHGEGAIDRSSPPARHRG